MFVSLYNISSTWPSKSWFSMKSWSPCLLLLALTPIPSVSFTRVLNGKTMLSALNWFWQKRLQIQKDRVIFLENPFRTLSCESREPSFSLHFSSFERSLIFSSRRSFVWISWETLNNEKNLPFHTLANTFTSNLCVIFK